jgi:hypothetical protein
LANDRDELIALRRLAELEAKAGGASAAPERDVLKEAAPYYLGPAGTPRAARDILKGVDEFTTKVGYGAGGLATDAASMAFGAEPETAAKVGVAANMAAQGLTGAAIGSVVRAPGMMMNAGRRWMRSAVKPSPQDRKSGEAAKAIETMLQKDINATGGSMADARSRVGALEDDIRNVLANSPELGNRQNVTKAIGKVLDDIKLNPNVISETADVNTALAKFMAHPELAQYGDQIPVSVMNKMKQAFYKSVGDKKMTPGYQVTMEDKANKALAHGMREEVGAKVPAIVPSLAEQSELLRVLKVAGPQVEREGNKNIIGLGSLAPRLEQVAVWMLDRYPWFKSYVGRQLYHNQRLPQELATGAVIAESGLRQKQE